MPTVFEEWIGRQRHAKDTVAIAPIKGLRATLNGFAREWGSEDPVPLLAHWLLFSECVTQDGLGDDGHPLRGDFLPPVALPRRMWAGGRLRFHEPIQVGDALSRTSTILNVEAKTGSTGELVFVTVKHDIARADGTLLIEEEQDLVYRETPRIRSELQVSTPAAAAHGPEPLSQSGVTRWERIVDPSATLLFRYSALTFNAHRIHYDREYATLIEGYPGLVVHGPLQTTLMLDLLTTSLPHAHVAFFSFRSRVPLIDRGPFSVRCEVDGNGNGNGDQVSLGTYTDEGAVAMEAVAIFEERNATPTTPSAIAAESQTTPSLNS